MNMVNERNVFMNGFRALFQLEKHAEDALGEYLGLRCEPCRNFAVALLKGVPPVNVLHLRCSDAQRWHDEVATAKSLLDSFDEEDEDD